MNAYEFTIYLDDHIDTDDEIGKLLDRCPDVIGNCRRNEVDSVTFMRESSDLKSAIRSAWANLKVLDHAPTRVEIEGEALVGAEYPLEMVDGLGRPAYPIPAV